MAAAMGAVKVGSGFDPAVTCGLMINPGAVANIHSLVRAAVGDGARTALGGAAIHRPSFFYQPTVLSRVSHGGALRRHEAIRPRPRRIHRRHLGVLRNPVHRHLLVTP